MNKKISWLIFISVLTISSISYAASINETFQNNGDGTVTDLKTGLMWKICSEGQRLNGAVCEGKPSLVSMTGNSSYEYATYNNWRIPTLYEVESIVKCQQPSTNLIYIRDPYNGCGVEHIIPTIFTSVFPNTRPTRYWTTTMSSQGFAVNLSFYTGTEHINDIHDHYAVRLVRIP